MPRPTTKSGTVLPRMNSARPYLFGCRPRARAPPRCEIDHHDEGDGRRLARRTSPVEIRIKPGALRVVTWTAIGQNVLGPRPVARVCSIARAATGARDFGGGTIARQMTLIGFLQAQNCTNFAGSWRHPKSRTDTLSPDYYRQIGRVLEEGKFHLGFFDDRLSMPDMYGRNHEHTVRHGIRCVKLDADAVLTVMGMATERLGLGATYSTSYYEPFHVARLFATLDLMTNGRAAWNVVTSLNDSESQNMGRDEAIEHDLRYDRADEFMETVLGHWDTWEDDAIVQHKTSGLRNRRRFIDWTTGAAISARVALYGAAFGPGTPRHHPGRPERSWQEFRGTMGRGDLCRPTEHRNR
jgi:Luciferase-like monooxygenase